MKAIEVMRDWIAPPASRSPASGRSNAPPGAASIFEINENSVLQLADHHRSHYSGFDGDGE
jgi:hypothetical protein